MGEMRKPPNQLLAHQIAHNTIFVTIENNLVDSAFEGYYRKNVTRRDGPLCPQYLRSTHRPSLCLFLLQNVEQYTVPLYSRLRILKKRKNA